MVSVFAIGPKVHGFKPDRGDGLLRAIEVRTTPSFGGEINSQPVYVITNAYRRCVFLADLVFYQAIDTCLLNSK
jgi:hypothetical protein